MTALDRIFDRARTLHRHIVLPEGDDPRVAEAASRAVADGIARITLLNGEAAGAASLRPADNPDFARLAAAYHELRAAKGVTAEAAADAMRQPIPQAAMMVRLGLADGTVGAPSRPPPTRSAPPCRSSAGRPERPSCPASS